MKDGCSNGYYCTAGNFRQESIFAISLASLIGKKFICKFFSCVNDCIADMATFTALAKILSLKSYCNTKIAGVGENFFS